MFKTDLWSFFQESNGDEKETPRVGELLWLLLREFVISYQKKNHKYQFSDNLHLQNPHTFDM